jgi:predicted 2-oxoglutarate/Fe(II)-dependent dioxygenase YbiX
MRSYSVGGRPFIPFHCDSARYTANIALNADEEFEGGKLLVLYNEQVRAIERATGEVTAHPSTLMHGVSAMTAGTRHSLIVFFH